MWREKQLMQLFIKKSLLTLTYLYVLNPFMIGPYKNIQFLLFYLIIICYLLFNWRTTYCVIYDAFFLYKRYILVIFITYLFICFCSLLSPLIHNTYDTSYFISIVLGIIRNGIKPFFLLVFTKKYISVKDDLMHEFFKYYIYSFIVYIFSTILFLIFPPIKDYWFQLINADSTFDRLSEKMSLARMITRWGLAGFSGFRHTLMCSLGVIFYIHLLINQKSMSLFKAYPIIILLFGNACYGRSGLIISCFFVFIYILYEVLINKKIKLAVYVLSLMFIIIFLLSFLREIREFDLWYKWAFAPLENLMTTGRIGDFETDYMFDKMYFMPEFYTLLFGDGYWLDPSNSLAYYKHTDIGYMRPMLFYGIFPQILSYFLSVFTIIYISKKNRNLRMLGIMFGILLFFFEMKGEVHYILTGYYITCFIGLNHGFSTDILHTINNKEV